MNRQALLNELNSNSYVMIRPSPVAGIGVFAIQKIPKGCRNMFAPEQPGEEYHLLTHDEVKALPDHARHLVENYCLYDEAVYYVPAGGFKKMDLSYFLNHADTPNLISINEGEFFEALRDIEAGEELFIDYGTVVPF